MAVERGAWEATAAAGTRGVDGFPRVTDGAGGGGSVDADSECTHWASRHAACGRAAPQPSGVWSSVSASLSPGRAVTLLNVCGCQALCEAPGEGREWPRPGPHPRVHAGAVAPSPEGQVGVWDCVEQAVQKQPRTGADEQNVSRNSLPKTLCH